MPRSFRVHIPGSNFLVETAKDAPKAEDVKRSVQADASGQDIRFTMVAWALYLATSTGQRSGAPLASSYKFDDAAAVAATDEDGVLNVWVERVMPATAPAAAAAPAAPASVPAVPAAGGAAAGGAGGGAAAAGGAAGASGSAAPASVPAVPAVGGLALGLPLCSGSAPPDMVIFANFVITDQTPVRSKVKGFAMSRMIGGTVQRDMTDATKVLVQAATADEGAMRGFLHEVALSFPPGSVSINPVVESTDPSHITMSYRMFRSVATSNNTINTSKQALSANEGDDLSVSGRASSRGFST